MADGEEGVEEEGESGEYWGEEREGGHGGG